MPTSAVAGRARAHAVGPLIGAAACWGAGTVVTKQVLGDVPPLTLLPLQLVASCLFLLAAIRVGRVRIRWSTETARLTVLGVLNPGIAYALGLLGLTSITASMSVLLWAVEPVLILLLAAAVLREQVPAARAAAIGIAVFGVLLIVYQPGAAGAAIGILLTLAGVAACASYTVLTRRLLIDDASLPVVLLQQAAALTFAALLTALAQMFGWQAWSTHGMSTATWLAAAGSGVLYYGLAFWLYLAGLRHVPATVAGAFLPLIPVFGVAVAYFTGDRLSGRQWIGAALVVATTAYVALRPLSSTRSE